MLRPFAPGDAPRVMEIWLSASRSAHSFIPMAYWEASVPMVEREILPRAETLVWEEAGQVLGFASVLEGDYLGALFVDPAAQGRGIGTALLEGAREGRDLLTLSVYRKNAGVVGFYLARGFRALEEGTDPATGEGELLMAWRREAGR